MMMFALVLGLAVGWAAFATIQYVSHKRVPNVAQYEYFHLYLIGFTLGTFLVTALMVLFFKVNVGTWGLRSYDFWGSYHEIEWHEMKEARPLNMLGARYLRVVSPGQATLWVPLFLANQGEFARLVQQHAGPEHPLVIALVLHMGE
jgi:hypothetical protein